MNRRGIVPIAVVLLAAGGAGAWYAQESVNQNRGVDDLASFNDNASVDDAANGASGMRAAVGEPSLRHQRAGPDSAAVPSRSPTVTFPAQVLLPKVDAPFGDSGSKVSWPEGIDPTGIPFPISESVRHECAKMADLPNGNCGGHEAVFAQLEKEGRDDKWAPAMENAIAEIIATKQGFYIRALDCRTTVCGVEIESKNGVFDRNAFTQLKERLSQVDRVNGYEKTDFNERVTVTSITFRRR